MILKTLYSRLALTLFVLLCAVGILLSLLLRESSNMYQQEVMQKLNSELARHIVSEQLLVRDGKVDRAAMDGLFHQLMIVNPAIELYLLDMQGRVIGFTAPANKVTRNQVDLDPLQRFFEDDMRLPILGDDPRNEDGRKVFSAAKIVDKGELSGYLYIVLAGEKYDHAMMLLRESFILDSALLIVIVALAAALVGGLISFSILTRRLRRLGNAMRHYSETGDDKEELLMFPARDQPRDEIDELGQQFNTMARRIRTQIRELQQMDSLRREMVANVSHDLRTPLTSLCGYLETLLLKNEQLSKQDQKQYLETALQHGKRLSELVEELFELARLDSVESVVYAEPFSMVELVQDVAQAFQLRAEQQGVQLDVVLNPEVQPIYGDIAMMQRVLENLLENGLRHTPSGGRVSIEVGAVSGKVIVRVADTGCGINEEDLPHIFERFYRRDRKEDSDIHVGLGLAIVKRVLELHGSAIKVQSNRAGGATFEFEINSV